MRINGKSSVTFNIGAYSQYIGKTFKFIRDKYELEELFVYDLFTKESKGIPKDNMKIEPGLYIQVKATDSEVLRLMEDFNKSKKERGG